MRAIDLCFRGRRRVISAWLADGVLFDPGPESCLDTLLTALGQEVPRAIALTHIHFDHAGGVGALIRRWPDVPVYVHERGAPHMASPERLVASAEQVFGAQGLRDRWGTMSPVPKDNLRILKGREKILDETFRVEYTPGHASHHVAYLHESTGDAFVGDVAGVRIEPEQLAIAPTPPPDIDLDVWPRSLEKIVAWRPRTLRLSHFGTVQDVQPHLECLTASMRLQAQQAARLDPEAFAAWYRAYLRSQMDPQVADVYLEASPVEHMWRGLERWRRRQARRTTAGPGV